MLGVVGFAGFLFAVGPCIISILYDSRYSAAGSMIQLLSFSLIFPVMELRLICIWP